MSAPVGGGADLAAEGGGHPGDGSVSRPSKNNRPARSKGGEPPESGYLTVGENEPGDLPGDVGLRQLATDEGRTLRDEAVMEVSTGTKARPWYRVLNEFQNWYSDYLNSHIEYEDPDGGMVRSRLENSYMPEYGDRYYAKVKGLEREIERRYDGLTTVMLTDTASTETETGKPRPPGDHMRDIADGWDVQRKALHRALEGYEWEYVKVWEPHESGYGHLHIGVFVEDPDDEIGVLDFEKVMRTYYESTKPAGWEAHKPENAVSVTHEMHDLGCYISEYIGSYGEELLERSMSEQMFYAVTWATNTRRVDFSNGAQELIRADRFRQETGLTPEDRGGGCMEEWAGDGEESGWAVDAIVNADSGGPEYHDPTTGGVETTAIDGVDCVDPPPEL